VVSLLGGDDRSKGSEREVYTRETERTSKQCPPQALQQDSRNQVGLELIQVDVERTIETEGRGDGRNDLSDKPVQVGEAWRRDVQVLLADIVNGLIVNLNKNHTNIQIEICYKYMP
jgi:hypothetical protein